MSNGGNYAKVPVQDVESNTTITTTAQKTDRFCMKRRMITVFTSLFILALSSLLYIFHSNDISFNMDRKKAPETFPKELLGKVYSSSDFRNKDGITPAYWENIPLLNKKNQNASHLDLNLTSTVQTWGPCYPPGPDEKPIHWDQLELGESAEIKYPSTLVERSKLRLTGVSDMCKPGFLIIGAGKCGTSSLYHYLIGHPRVLPASEKQVHYFKYYPNRDLAWYYTHFPTTKSFLSSGALMTGEAAPGYIPYPGVAHLVKKRMPGPKILTIAREPLDRAWSSYNYNYVREALKIIKRKASVMGIPTGKSDEYYKEHHIFSFEDFIRTELSLLKKCLEPGGEAETKSREEYYKWFGDEYQRREKEVLPPMVDIIGICYPQPRAKSSPREQWQDMTEANPKKLIKVPNLHLLEAFIGRGMYAVQVEWWYAAHPKHNNYLVCSEDLKNRSAETMFNVSRFLGLPDFDFTEVVSEGMFNVAGHKGYDKSISWEEAKKEEEESQATEVAISDDLRDELMEFLQPHNERLFALAGKRCPW